MIERLIDRAARGDGHRSGRVAPAQSPAAPRRCRTAPRPARSMTAAISRASWSAAWRSRDWPGFAARRAASEARGRRRGRARRLLYRARRRHQRAHGAALRSGRHGDHPRRHAFARAGPRHDLCADGGGLARRAVRRRSASSKAIPTRCRSGAAPMPREARWSAAARLKLAADGDHRQGASAGGAR